MPSNVALSSAQAAAPARPRQGDGWRPLTFYNKGRIDRGQFTAAARLREDLNLSQPHGPVVGMRFAERVDNGRGMRDPAVNLDARRRLDAALAAIGIPEARQVISAVVLNDQTIEQAGDLHSVRNLVLDGWGADNRRPAAMALFAAGLRALARHYEESDARAYHAQRAKNSPPKSQ